MADNKRRWSPPQMIWSALLAVVAWTAIGFSWFGYGFDWSTPIGASRMTEEVMVESFAEICVAQARASADAQADLARLERIEFWKRREFIEDAQWATMPGSEEPRSGVADRCAVKLLDG